MERFFFSLDNLKIRYRVRCDSGLWENVFDQLEFSYVDYLPLIVDYYEKYFFPEGGVFDASLVLFNGDEPVGLWPLTLDFDNPTPAISSQGRPVLPPVFSALCPSTTKVKLEKKCYALLRAITEEYGVKNLDFVTGGVGAPLLGEWHAAVIRDATACNASYQNYSSLEINTGEFWSQMRKSYKNLIHRGRKLWSITVSNGSDLQKDWSDFKLLHLACSGRVTRASETWLMQERMIKDQCALLICARNQGDLVGAGFFVYSGDEALYFSGAYDRSLFEHPIAHAVVFQAIEELRARGCKWLRLGEHAFPAKTTEKKVLAISDFKRGFATHLCPQFNITHGNSY